MRLQFWRRQRSATAPPPCPDPIDHPSIARMSLRELADLPMWTARVAEPAPPREPATNGATWEVD